MSKPFSRHYFTGDGINRAYNLEYPPVSILDIQEGDTWQHHYTERDHHLFLLIANRRKYEGGYTIVGRQIVFDEAPTGPFWVDYEFEVE